MSSRGFSLVEILVTLVLFGICMLAVVPLFIVATRSTASAGEMSSLGALAVQRTELLQAVAFDTLTAGGSLTGNVSGYFDDANPDFIVRWRITDDATPATMKTIEVRSLALRAPMGQPKEVTLVGVRAQTE